MNIKKKLYIANYENKILKDILFLNQLERWVPGCSYKHTEIEHENRYKWVSKYTKGKIVLDIACGTGRGSYIISTLGEAKRVVGGDIDKDTIKYATSRYARKNLKFRIINAEKVGGLSINPDIVISFETIEHLKEPASFLLGVKKILKNNGKLIISTPISEFGHNTHPFNQYHIQEWNINNFIKLIKNYFSNVEIYQQIGDKPHSSRSLLAKYFSSKNNRKPYSIHKSLNNDQFGNYQIIVATT